MPFDQERARQRPLSDKVVIADDDATQRIFASTVVSRMGFTPVLARVMDVRLPDASFYLWAGIPESLGLDDADFARELYAATGVTVLPGSYLAREAHGVNPGHGRIRIALVAPLADCVQAAECIAHFVHTSV